MGSHACATDAVLLAATTSDPSAFDAFYGRHERGLLAYFARRTREPELTADLTGEVFASVLEHAARFDAGRAAGGNAAPWLFAIAHNTLASSVRHRRVAAEARRGSGCSSRCA